MADTHGLGPCAARRGGSTPLSGTTHHLSLIVRLTQGVHPQMRLRTLLLEGGLIMAAIVPGASSVVFGGNAEQPRSAHLKDFIGIA